MAKFLFTLLAVATFIGLCVWIASAQGWIVKPSFSIKTLIFLTVSTGLVYRFLYKVENPQTFLQLYLLTITLKLIAYLAYNLVVILQNRSSALGNVVFFMVSYFIFTGLEIGFLYRKIAGGDKS